VPYPEQLAAKERAVREAVAAYPPSEFRPILPSPQVLYYRNKMEFAFSGLKDEPPLLGLRKKGKFDRIVDLKECLLMSPEAPVLLEAARRWAEKEKVPTYHLKSHRGFLRYLAIREGKNTGQRMVHLVTAAGALAREPFLSALEATGVRADTVVWSVNDGLSDVAYGSASEVLRGSGHIEETLGGLPFRLSPTTFFQTNTRAAEVLYGVVGDFMGGKADILMDVYCGTGSIGLFLARRAGRVVGVESHAPSVESARANAQAQGASHAEFHSLDAAALSGRRDLMVLWRRAGTVAVVDPPRPGLSAPVRRLLLEDPVERVVYVSCNPKALAADLAVLSAVYAVEKVQPVDLFPHTPHVETVVSLRK
jgi:23S rRNA (uracil1939-C5)-methyltransferase